MISVFVLFDFRLARSWLEKFFKVICNWRMWSKFSRRAAEMTWRKNFTRWKMCLERFCDELKRLGCLYPNSFPDGFSQKKKNISRISQPPMYLSEAHTKRNIIVFQTHWQCTGRNNYCQIMVPLENGHFCVLLKYALFVCLRRLTVNGSLFVRCIKKYFSSENLLSWSNWYCFVVLLLMKSELVLLKRYVLKQSTFSADVML